MAYTLRRTRDGAGDSGLMSDLSIPTFEEGSTTRVASWETKHNARPEVGGLMTVGSHYARTYSHQDWWRTTLITEILEEKEEGDQLYVRFKTGNSEYEWTGPIER